MKQYYYIDSQNQTQGPIPGKQLIDLVNARIIGPETLVVQAGETQWIPISQFLQKKMEPASTPLCPETKDFYVHKNGQTVGPYSPNQLEQLRTDKLLQPQDQIARGGGDKWVPLASFAGGAFIGALAVTFAQTVHAVEQEQIYYYYNFGEGETFDAVYLDTNHDGNVDFVAADTNHDGNMDFVAADTNHDGNMDFVAADTNHDGNVDFIAADTNHDGNVDFIAADTNHDGNVDFIAADTNHDDYFDAGVADTNFDGIIDSETVDTNIDVGIPDFLSDLFG